MPGDAPLTVSCLMVTHRSLAVARRAIDCFASQDYQPRELVIVADGYDHYDAIARYADERCQAPVVTTAVPRHSLSLGSLRNTAIALARGELICQWDDDDFAHPHRLTAQIRHLQAHGADACFLTDQLHFVSRTRSLYWCNWSRPEVLGLRWPTIPNTLLCRNDGTVTYPETGPVSRRSEDAYVMRTLHQRVRVAQLSGVGWLYVYVSHGENTWNESHHLEIIRRTALDAPELIRHKSDLTSHLAVHGFGPVVVRDGLGREVYAL
jgi:glycosyltransferase involved in cell wall biosynthesis